MKIRIDRKEIIEVNNADSIFADTECDGICKMYLDEGCIVEILIDGNWVEI